VEKYIVIERIGFGTKCTYYSEKVLNEWLSFPENYKGKIITFFKISNEFEICENKLVEVN